MPTPRKLQKEHAINGHRKQVFIFHTMLSHAPFSGRMLPNKAVLCIRLCTQTQYTYRRFFVENCTHAWYQKLRIYTTNRIFYYTGWCEINGTTNHRQQHFHIFILATCSWEVHTPGGILEVAQTQKKNSKSSTSQLSHLENRIDVKMMKLCWQGLNTRALKPDKTPHKTDLIEKHHFLFKCTTAVYPCSLLLLQLLQCSGLTKLLLKLITLPGKHALHQSNNDHCILG